MSENSFSFRILIWCVSQFRPNEGKNSFPPLSLGCTELINFTQSLKQTDILMRISGIWDSFGGEVWIRTFFPPQLAAFLPLLRHSHLEPLKGRARWGSAACADSKRLEFSGGSGDRLSMYEEITCLGCAAVCVWCCRKVGDERWRTES